MSWQLGDFRYVTADNSQVEIRIVSAGGGEAAEVNILADFRRELEELPILGLLVV